MVRTCSYHCWLFRVKFLCFKSGKVSHRSCSLCTVHFCIFLSWENIFGMLFVDQPSLALGLLCLSGGGRGEGTAHRRLFSWLVKLSRACTAWMLERCLLVSFWLITPLLLYLRLSGNIGEYGQLMFPEEHKSKSSPKYYPVISFSSHFIRILNQNPRLRLTFKGFLLCKI